MGNLIKKALERISSIVALATDPFKVRLRGNCKVPGAFVE